MCRSRAPFGVWSPLDSSHDLILNTCRVSGLPQLYGVELCSADDPRLPSGLLQLEAVPFVSYTIFRGLWVGLKNLLFGALSVH